MLIDIELKTLRQKQK